MSEAIVDTTRDRRAEVPGLRRSVGLPTAVALVLGELIGVGIFLTPAGMARDLASPGLVIAVWLALGFTTFCGALCYGELAARLPEAGGTYVYLREAFGRRVAFLYGWQVLAVVDPGFSAALATGLAAYVVAVAPGLPAKGVAVAFVFLVAGANVLGLRLAAGVARVLAVAKVSLLLLIVVWGFGGRLGDASRFLPFWARHDGAGPLLPAIGGAIVAAFFSLGGWWDVAKLAGEVREPQRNLPRAMMLGVTVATVLYVLTSAVFFYLVPLEQVGSGETFAAQAGAALFGARGAQAFSLVVVLCIASGLFAFMTAAPRVYYAMANDGLAVGAMGALHPRTGAPVRAIAVQAVLASLLVVLGRFDQIIGYFVSVLVIFLSASVAGLFRLRRRGPAPAYTTPAFPLPVFGFLAMCVAVIVLFALRNPLQAGLGVAVTALGIPVYALLERRR
jgi:APA family basic amino acid/polyamine antiporter